MRNIFIEAPKSIINEWKSMRRCLTNDISDYNQLTIVVNFWSQAPTMSQHLLDWDNPKNWPDPWNIINDNKYDEDMIALGMFYSLNYSQCGRWENRIQLALVSDQEKTFQHLAIIVDNHYILNVQYNSIVEISMQHFTIHQKYQYQDKIHSIVIL